MNKIEGNTKIQEAIDIVKVEIKHLNAHLIWRRFSALLALGLFSIRSVYKQTHESKYFDGIFLKKAEKLTKMWRIRPISLAEQKLFRQYPNSTCANFLVQNSVEVKTVRGKTQEDAKQSIYKLSQRMKVMKENLVRKKTITKAIVGSKPTKTVMKFGGSSKDKIYTQEDRAYRTSIMQYFTVSCQNANLMEHCVEYFKALTPKELEIEAYETLFQCLAKTGDLETLKDFWSELKKHNIVPSLKCYIAAFQCLGHTDIDQTHTTIQKIAQELSKGLSNEHDDFDLNRLVLNCIPRTKIDFDNLLKGIRLIYPDFEPKMKLDCDAQHVYNQNDLLSALYEFPVSQLTPQLTHMTKDDLERQLHRQFEMEKVGMVEVKGITKYNLDSEESDLKKAQLCVDILMKDWKQQMSTIVQNRIKKMYASLKQHPKQSGNKRALPTLPTAAFAKLIPFGKSYIEFAFL